MLKKIWVAGLITLTTYQNFGQDIQTTIKTQALDMARALIRNDFNAFSKYIHPAILEMAGGREKLKNDMDSANSAMKQFGVQFKKILIGNPGVVISYQNQLQCVVPENTDMLTPMGEINLETSLIAISADQGKNWYFIDTNVYRVDKLKKVLPGLSPGLVIPAQKQPEITPNR
jgi:hypothetical protein